MAYDYGQLFDIAASGPWYGPGAPNVPQNLGKTPDLNVTVGPPFTGNQYTLPSLGDLMGSIPKMSDLSGAKNPVGDVVWWLTGRYITVFVGLLFIAGGLYLFGTSSVSQSLENIARKAVA